MNATPPTDIRLLDAEHRQRAAHLGLHGSFADKARYVLGQLALFARSDEALRALIGARIAMILEVPRLGLRRERFLTSPRRRRLLRERPQITAELLRRMRALPAGTVGGAYARFAQAQQLDPTILPPVDGLDAEEAFVFDRGVQTHDLWHVLTGIDTHFRGEAALVAFLAGQDPSTFTVVMTVMGAFGTALQAPRMLPLMWRAYHRGRRADDLIAVPWEDLWETPLDEVRFQLGIEVEHDPLLALHPALLA
jgi:ubiquinone biosynthesis protein Coq4